MLYKDIEKEGKKKYPICAYLTVKRNRQVIRVQVKAAENANEERLKALVLNQVDFMIFI